MAIPVPPTTNTNAKFPCCAIASLSSRNDLSNLLFTSYVFRKFSSLLRTFDTFVRVPHYTIIERNTVTFVRNNHSHSTNSLAKGITANRYANSISNGRTRWSNIARCSATPPLSDAHSLRWWSYGALNWRRQFERCRTHPRGCPAVHHGPTQTHRYAVSMERTALPTSQ